MQFLLVEDDVDLRREVGEYLLRRHHGVIVLASAADARAFLERKPAPKLDAVLCDVNLPDGDGFELYIRYAAQSTALRWVLLTGDADQQQLDNSARHPRPAGCDAGREARVAAPACRSAGTRHGKSLIR